MLRVPSCLNHCPQLGRCVLDVGVPVLACPTLNSKQATAMNVFEIAIGKFVSSFGVLSIALVNSKMPFCVFTKAMLPNELILELCRRPVFGPGSFSVDHNMSAGDKLFAVR